MNCKPSYHLPSLSASLGQKTLVMLVKHFSYDTFA